MLFDMTIPASEFKKNQLKVLSPVILAVTVLDDQGQLMESFETDPANTIYTFETRLLANWEVKVSLIPGQVAAFYPVVQAV